MSFIYDKPPVNPIHGVMREKTAVNVESIKAAAEQAEAARPQRELARLSTLDYTIQSLSGKHGGNHAKKW